MLMHIVVALITLACCAGPLRAQSGAEAPAAGAAAPAAAPTARPAAAEPASDSPPAGPVITKLAAEAQAVRPLVATDIARAFLAAVAELPAPEPRVLWRSDETGRHLSDRAAAELDETTLARWKRRELDAEAFYFTRYGSPLAYARALEVLGGAGLATLSGVRLLDYGYGTVGHLRLMALCSADAHGVDVDNHLTALYSEPGDQGVLGAGRVTLHDGRWPTDEAVRSAIGEGYDLFLSKNTLKRGYVHPSRTADPRHRIDLGVDDATYLAQLHALLKPGGLALLYNICPPEAGPEEPYAPWADGRSPFTREQWEAAGFEVLALDVVDSDAARALGVALGWGTATEMELGIHAWYTLARRG
jgi:hypothetical protein